jgi:hypothetical protein
MKNLTWKAVSKKNCDGTISASAKIKYKKTVCKFIIPDLNAIGEDEDLYEQFHKKLKAAFGKKKAKKIEEQINNDMSVF